MRGSTVLSLPLSQYSLLQLLAIVYFLWYCSFLLTNRYKFHYSPHFSILQMSFLFFSISSIPFYHLKENVLTCLRLKKQQSIDVRTTSITNRTACIRYQCMHTAVLSCHRSLINTVEKMYKILNTDQNFDHQMSLSKSKCWYSNNCLHFLVNRSID